MSETTLSLYGHRKVLERSYTSSSPAFKTLLWRICFERVLKFGLLSPVFVIMRIYKMDLDVDAIYRFHHTFFYPRPLYLMTEFYICSISA